MLEDVGAAGQRKEEAVDGAPEVGGVADEYNAQRTAESQLEVLFHYPAEEEQGEHVEEQVPPAAVDCTVGQHPVPFLPVPD